MGSDSDRVWSSNTNSRVIDRVWSQALYYTWIIAWITPHHGPNSLCRTFPHYFPLVMLYLDHPVYAENQSNEKWQWENVGREKKKKTKGWGQCGAIKNNGAPLSPFSSPPLFSLSPSQLFSLTRLLSLPLTSIRQIYLFRPTCYTTVVSMKLRVLEGHRHT